MGQYSLLIGKPVEAEAHLRQVLSEFPRQIGARGEAWVYLLDALIFQEKNEAAVREATALAADQRIEGVYRAWALSRLGLLYKQKLRLAEALDALASLEALPIAPDLLAPKMTGAITTAEIMIDQHRFKGAIDYITNTLAGEGGKVTDSANWLRVRLAQACMSDAQFDRATRACEDVLSDHANGRASGPQATWALVWSARSARAQSDYDGAFSRLQMAIALADPSDPAMVFDAQLESGDVLQEKARRTVGRLDADVLFDQALEHYRQALQVALDRGLLDDRQDRARVRIASEFSRRGQQDKAIAWLRAGITDPATLSDSDRELAERIGSMLGESDAASAWQAFLESPHGTTDPTAAQVLDEFGHAPARASAQELNDRFLRLHWRGELHLREGQLAAAIDAHAQSLGVASTPEDRATACSRLAVVHNTLASQARTTGGYKDADQEYAKALEYANQALPFWAEAAQAGSDGHAHGCMEKAVKMYEGLAAKEEAVLAAGSFVDLFSAPEASPAKLAFAQMLLMKAFGSRGQYERAIEVAQLVQKLYGERPETEFEDINAICQIESATMLARLGKARQGQAQLEAIRARFGSRYDGWIRPHEVFCARMVRTAANEK